MADVIYLDNNATTRPLPEVVEAVSRCLTEGWANPSSIHRPGTAARQQVELARESVSRLVGCQDRELLFCSGGTESVNLALFGTMESSSAQGRRPLLVTSKLEHSAVRESAEAWVRRGGEVLWAEHTPEGLVDLGWLESTLRSRSGDLALVSLMWVNNETGVMQPIDSIGSLCREHNVRFHVDATQAVGRIPVEVSALQVDLLTFASHKFHGPKGVGGLYIRRGIRLARQIIGGPQERDRRGGTENVPGIVGMGVAADAARRWLDACRLGSTTANGNAELVSPRTSSDSRVPMDWPSSQAHGGVPPTAESSPDRAARQLEPVAGNEAPASLPTLEELTGKRDRFEQAILSRCPGSRANGSGAARAWTTTNIAFPRLEAEAILLLLSEQGVCASAGAACSSGSLDPSPVLLAMGVPPELAHGSVRFSLSRYTTGQELDLAVERITGALAKLSHSSEAAIRE